MQLRPTGAATPVGTDQTVACGNGGAYDKLADKYYFINSTSATTLASFDPMTSVVTDIAPINGAVNDAWQLIIDGASHGYITDSNDFYSINLATAETTLIGATGVELYALAFNPVDGLIYNFSRTSGEIDTINPLTGAGTSIHTGVTWSTGSCPAGLPGNNGGLTGTTVDGVTFDTAGIAWIQMDGGCQSDIEAWSPVTNESWSTGTLVDATHLVQTTAPYNFYSETFIIGRDVNTPAPTPTEEPTLATTGVNGTQASLLAAGGAVLALLGAGALRRLRVAVR